MNDEDANEESGTLSTDDPQPGTPNTELTEGGTEEQPPPPPAESADAAESDPEDEGRTRS